MQEIPVSIRILPHGEGLALPAYATAGSAGCDLRAAIPEPRTLAPGERAVIETGIAVAIPEGYEGQVRMTRYAARHQKPARALGAGVIERLTAHPWRGNVRELKHVVEMLVLFAEGDVIAEEDLPRALRTGAAAPPAREAPASFAGAVEEFERKLLADAIAAAGGIKAEAARRLKLDGNQIKYLCRKYSL